MLRNNLSDGRWRIIRFNDVILNLDTRLNFDVIYIHRANRSKRGPITDIAVVRGEVEVHLYGDDATGFLDWLKRLPPD